MGKRTSSAVDTRSAKRARNAASYKTSDSTTYWHTKASVARSNTRTRLAVARRSSRRDSDASSSDTPRRNVATRSMTLRKRTQFPFLQLPAELRNQIYEYMLDFKGVAGLLTNHYKAHVHDNTSIEWPNRDVHPLLLVNKQMTREAVYILHRKTLWLPHSTTPNSLITDVASVRLLENLRKVDITRDDSFGEMHTWCDFLEFFRLIRSAVSVWTKSHKLQELTIAMQGAQVVTHLATCPAQGHCYFLDEIEKMMSSLEELRGIKTVNFGGFLEEYATEAKKWMQTPPVYLLKTLDDNLRKRIFHYLVDINDANDALVKASNTAVKSWNPPATMDAIAPSMTSPSLLRVNRKINEEVLEAMYDKTFTISAPPPHHAHTCTSVTKFIGPNVLQNVRHLALDIDSRGLASVAADWRILIKELAEKLKATSERKLQTLHINIKDAAWIKEQIKAERKESSTGRVSKEKETDFYGLKALSKLTTKRLSRTWLHQISFGDGVSDDVKRTLEDRLCGGKSNRHPHETNSAYGPDVMDVDD
ncbi:coiled-coil domain-containing protein mtmr15 [Diplodia corticola]|uniref:Coiled-coil domain-containing protein mtmr15 n=1 Tax=Diplodia corticola TaxID=236234 RepID=A0A1J9RP53_9PEZI|nr:coiled-coil domain-containing protein mtmr15 [Diplodia corticola]OJD34331.1 coiled-coil domain-containing protein mtmr15 [Diplodia corticola]